MGIALRYDSTAQDILCNALYYDVGKSGIEY